MLGTGGERIVWLTTMPKVSGFAFLPPEPLSAQLIANRAPVSERTQSPRPPPGVWSQR